MSARSNGARGASKPRERRVLTSANGPRRKEEYVPKDQADARKPPPPAPQQPRRPSLSNKPAPKGLRQPPPKPPPKGIAPTTKAPGSRAPREPSAPAQQHRPPPPKPAPPPRPEPKAAEPEPSEDDEEEDYDDESFEDYDDDDFEDDEGDEEPDQQQAVNSKPPPPPPRRAGMGVPQAAAPSPGTQQPEWMNVGPPPVELNSLNRPLFSAMKLSLSQPYPKRCFEQAPITQHEQLARHIGTFSCTSNQMVQTSEESKTAEVQTDDLEPREQSCQAPEDLSSGGAVSYKTASGPASLKRDFDPAHFSNFLRSASQTITTLLAESSSALEAAKNRKIDEVQGNLDLSMGCVALPEAPIGGHRPIEHMCFSQFQQHLLLVAYGAPEYAVQPNDTLELIARKLDVEVVQLLTLNKSRYKGLTPTSKLQLGSWIVVPANKAGSMPSSKGGQGLMCLWDVNSLTHPVAIMVSESHPTHCCFSNRNSSMTVYGVTVDGSVVAWDLRESPAMHITCKMPGGYGLVLRRPSYSTDGLLDDAHIGQIRCLQTIATGSGVRSAGDRTLDQLATLDEQGGLCVWMVIELERADVAGSESDLCLGIGSKVKIVKNFSLDLSQGSLLRTLDLDFRPGNMNDVIVATGSGHILHNVRHGRKASPLEYEGPGACDACSVQFSPFLHPYFLAAYANGTVSLYHQDNPVCIRSWTGFSLHPIKEALWLPSKPSVFLVSNIEGQVFVFNLLKDPNYPVSIAQMDAKGTTHRASLSKVQVSPRGVGHPFMATSYSNGCVNIHTLSGIYAESAGSDTHRLQALLEGREYKESEYLESLAAESHQIQQEPELDLYAGDDLLGDMFGVVGANSRKAKAGRRA